jgi:hypothetical protein
LRGVLTLVSHVHLPVLLAGPGPSGSAGPSRRCRGCSRPRRRPPDQAAPSFTNPLRRSGGRGLSPPLGHACFVAHAAACPRHPPPGPVGDAEQRRPEAPSDPRERGQQAKDADRSGEWTGRCDGHGDMDWHRTSCVPVGCDTTLAYPQRVGWGRLLSEDHDIFGAAPREANAARALAVVVDERRVGELLSDARVCESPRAFSAR